MSDSPEDSAPRLKGDRAKDALLTQAMAESARQSMRLREQITKHIASISLLCDLEQVNRRDRIYLVEAYSRSLIGGIVALYLDYIGPRPRDESKRFLLSAADAISASLHGPDRGKGGRQ